MEGGARSRIACALSFRRGDLLGDELFRPLRAGSRRSLPGCLGGALLLGLRGGAGLAGRPALTEMQCAKRMLLKSRLASSSLPFQASWRSVDRWKKRPRTSLRNSIFCRVAYSCVASLQQQRKRICLVTVPLRGRLAPEVKTFQVSKNLSCSKQAAAIGRESLELPTILCNCRDHARA